MRQVNIHEAKTHLSRLADEVGEGEPIILAKAGKPVAALVSIDTLNTLVPPPTELTAKISGPLDPLKGPHIDQRRFGFMKGKISVPDDFDTMFQDEIIAMFEGGK